VSAGPSYFACRAIGKVTPAAAPLQADSIACCAWVASMPFIISAAAAVLSAFRISRVVKKCRPLGRIDRKAGNSSACASWQGPSPFHSATLTPCKPGAQAPVQRRPAPGGR